MALKNEKLLIIIFLLVVLTIAAFFRLWQLDKIPPGLYPDVAINGNDAFQTLQTGNFKVFYPENNGREGLMMWLIALSFSIFEPSVWAIKIVAAIIGILTVLGLYLLTKEIFQNTKYPAGEQTPYGAGKIQDTRYIALLSSFFLAISFWHVNFSRIGFRAILLPFILVFGLYFLFKGFRQKKILDFIIAGIFFGLGFYTYISYRFIVLLLPLILICFWFIYSREKLRKQFLFFVFCFLFFVFIVALPIAIYFLQNPQDFVFRAAGISVFAQENPIMAFLKSLISHLAMFNFYGDPNWRHNFSGSPVFPWPVGILFLIGFFLSIKEFILSIKHKICSLPAPHNPEGICAGFIVHCSLLAWFFIMLLPGILTAEGIPHALRVIGVIPVVYIFAALGGWHVYKWGKKIFSNKKLFIVLCSLFFVFVTFAEFNKYFFVWAKNPNVEGAFTKKFAEIGYYLNSLPLETSKYVIVNEPGVPVPWPDGIPMPAQTVMFIESTKFGELQSTYLLPESLDQIKIVNKGVIVPMKYEENLAEEIKRRFPQGEVREEKGIWIYEIK